MDVRRRIEQPGRKSHRRNIIRTLNSTHIIPAHIVVHYRSSGLQQGALRGAQASLCVSVSTVLVLMHVFSVR